MNATALRHKPSGEWYIWMPQDNLWGTSTIPDLLNEGVTMEQYKDAVGKGFASLPCKEEDLELVPVSITEIKAPKPASMFDEVLKRTDLKTRLFVQLQMADYENWNNGDYLGDMTKLLAQVQSILETVYKWKDDGAPGHEDLDLQRFEDNTSSGLSSV